MCVFCVAFFYWADVKGGDVDGDGKVGRLLGGPAAGRRF